MASYGLGGSVSLGSNTAITVSCGGRWLCSLYLCPCCRKWARVLSHSCLFCKWEISQFLEVMICWLNRALIKRYVRHMSTLVFGPFQRLKKNYMEQMHCFKTYIKNFIYMNTTILLLLTNRFSATSDYCCWSWGSIQMAAISEASPLPFPF